MIVTAALSLAAGGLTVLAPCVLPFLPVIVGGSLRGERRRPYIVAASLVVSLLVFTVALKATTALIHVDPRVWTTVSGGIVILLGVSMLFPDLWARLSTRLGLDRGSHSMLERATRKKQGTGSAVLTGFALGPVFSSCSPTYAWVVAAVLPASTARGLLYLSLYCVGVAGALLAISLLGRRLIERLRWAANPRGWFQRTVAVLFIIVGVFVMTGLDKTVQTWLVRWAPSLSAVEEALIPDDEAASSGRAPGVDVGDSQLSDPDDSPQAPDFSDIAQWINSDALTLEELRGKVVLVDFWTYSCINCIRTQPYLNSWYETYHDQGLEIVGVHAPEFSFEKVPSNVQRAVEDAQIKYPVALDNSFSTWNAYRNRYWPAKYLIDAQGRIRYIHTGEGDYEGTESAIRELIGASGSVSKGSRIVEKSHAAQNQSPETYLGSRRAQGYVGSVPLEVGSASFHAARQLEADQWTLEGKWMVEDEGITAASEGAQLTYRFQGRDMYLVLSGPQGAAVHVDVDGLSQAGGRDVLSGNVELDSERLYHLVRLPDDIRQATVTLTFAQGVRAYAFTFGG